MKPYLLFGAWNLVLVSSSFAVSTSFWEVREFEKCKLENVLLDKDGFASLAPEVKTVWDNPEVYIWTMLELGEALYIGTGAEGKVYKLEKGIASVVLDTREAGVFSLAHNKGKIYVGTSPNGRIFVINEDGTSEVFEDTHEKYVWKIVFDESANLYAATGTSGLILRIKEGKIDTFYSTGKMNVPFLTYIDKYFYAGTGEDGLLFKIDRNKNGYCIYDAEEGEITGVVRIDTLLFFSATHDTSGAVYCVYPDNRVRRIWQINSQIRGIQKTGEALLVAADKRIYKIDQEGMGGLLVELPQSISCMQGNLFGTSELGKVYRLSEKLSQEGSIESQPYDTKSISRWGRLEFNSSEEVKFMTRTGNIEKPDQTWSEWTEVAPDFTINSPRARFIQWKAIISSPTAKLKEVKISFLPQNEPPKITKIKLVEQEKKEGNPEGKKIVWSATDPNKDSLIFDIYFKLTEEKNWTLLKEAVNDTFYNIDPKAFPDGEYLIKIIAYDTPSNPKEDALKGELVSEPCVIDNSPPRVKIIGVKDEFLYFEIEDNFNIKACSFALDGGKWELVFPIDKIFDAKTERFKIEVGQAKKVVIKAEDTSGNTILTSKLIE